MGGFRLCFLNWKRTGSRSKRGGKVTKLWYTPRGRTGVGLLARNVRLSQRGFKVQALP